MKQWVMYCGLLASLGLWASAEVQQIGGITGIDNAKNTKQTQPLPYVKPNPTLITLDRDAWKFLKTSFVFELEQATSSKNAAGTFLENYADQIAEVVAAPIALFSGFLAQERFNLNVENDFSIWLAATVSVGAILFYSTKFFWHYFGSILADHTAIAAYALNNFMDAWEDYRDKCPAEVKPFFDNVAIDYKSNDHLVSLTDDQALKVIQTMLTLSALMEHLDEMVLKHFLTRQEEEESEAVYRALVHTTIKSALPSLTRAAPNLKTQRNQWEYLAQQLGILNRPQEIVAPIKKFFHEFEAPIVLGIGFPVGVLIGSYASSLIPGINNYNTEIFRAGEIIGGLMGAVFMSITSRFFGITNQKELYKQQLEGFIAQWPAHKQYCPESVTQLFNQLSVLYRNNNQTLDLDDTFIEELYRMVAKMWLKISSAVLENQKDAL